MSLAKQKFSEFKKNGSLVNFLGKLLFVNVISRICKKMSLAKQKFSGFIKKNGSLVNFLLYLLEMRILILILTDKAV